jgi:hypothetical protein
VEAELLCFKPKPGKICRQMAWVNWQCDRFRLDETTLLRLIAASLPLPLLTTSARKTPFRSARLEAEIALLPFCPRRFGPLTRFVVAREAFSGTNEFAVTANRAV